MPDWVRYLHAHLDLPEMKHLREERIIRELADHLEDLFREAREQGLSEVEAEQMLRERIGDWREAAAEIAEAEQPSLRSDLGRWYEDREQAARDRGGFWALFADLGQDIRFALRTVRKSPVFSAVAILTLAVGIGANATIFTFLYGSLANPLGFEDVDRLIHVSEYRAEQGRDMAVAYPNFADWRKHTRSFENLAAFRSGTFTLLTGGEPERISGAEVSWSLTSLLRVPPEHGRSFLPAEEGPGAPGVVLMGWKLWQRRFGADPGLVGRPLTIDGEPVTVVGIMPEEFAFPDYADLWMPLRRDPDGNRGAHNLAVVGRLAPGVTLDQAETDLQSIAADLARQYPLTNADANVRLNRLEDEYMGMSRQYILIFYVVVSLVLLLACANLANLLLARAADRKREVAVRCSLGAGRTRIARMLLTESVLLALAGGAVGIVLGEIGRRLILTGIPVEIPYNVRFDLNLPAALCLTAIAAGCGLLVGLAPVAGSWKLNLTRALHAGGGRISGGRNHGRLRSTLVAFEVGLALVILIGAGLMMKSIVKLHSVEPGFDPAGVLTMRLSLPESEYASAGERVRFHRELQERIRALPGMVSASASYNLPMGRRNWGSSYYVEGTEPLPAGQRPNANHRIVLTDYFRTLRIPILRGRDFSPTDTDRDAPPVVIVNRQFAERWWPGENPLGRRIRYYTDPTENDPWMEVVGVVEGVHHYGLRYGIYEGIYRPYAQYPVTELSLVIRTGGDPLEFVDPVRREIRAMDSTLPPFDIHTMEQVMREGNWLEPLYAWLFNAFSVIGLLLAAMGIYGLVVYSVVQRTREFGIRMALGAAPERVVRQVVRQGAGLAAIGLAGGLLAAFGFMRFLSSLLYEVSPNDPLIYLLTSATMLGVVVLASYLPARKATAIHPVDALRSE